MTLEEDYNNLFETIKPNLIKVMELGARKYGVGSWRSAINHLDNHNSMFHHLAESYKETPYDFESGVDPAYHLIIRTMFQVYIRMQNENIATEYIPDVNWGDKEL